LLGRRALQQPEGKQRLLPEARLARGDVDVVAERERPGVRSHGRIPDARDDRPRALAAARLAIERACAAIRTRGVVALDLRESDRVRTGFETAPERCGCENDCAEHLTSSRARARDPG